MEQSKILKKYFSLFFELKDLLESNISQLQSVSEQKSSSQSFNLDQMISQTDSHFSLVKSEFLRKIKIFDRKVQLQKIEELTNALFYQRAIASKVTSFYSEKNQPNINAGNLNLNSKDFQPIFLDEQTEVELKRQDFLSVDLIHKTLNSELLQQIEKIERLKNLFFSKSHPIEKNLEEAILLERENVLKKTKELRSLFCELLPEKGMKI